MVRSTLSGEALAMAEAIDVGMYLASMYAELTTGVAEPAIPLICFTEQIVVWGCQIQQIRLGEKAAFGDWEY